MARAGTHTRSGFSGTYTAVRDNSSITNTDLLADVLYQPSIPWPTITPRTPAALLSVEDTRRWSPYRSSPLDVGGNVASVRKRQSARSFNSNPFKFGFPDRVVVCVRRKQRREVIMAKGYGGGRHRRPKWKADSYYRC